MYWFVTLSHSLSVIAKSRAQILGSRKQGKTLHGTFCPAEVEIFETRMENICKILQKQIISRQSAQPFSRISAIFSIVLKMKRQFDPNPISAITDYIFSECAKVIVLICTPHTYSWGNQNIYETCLFFPLDLWSEHSSTHHDTDRFGIFASLAKYLDTNLTNALAIFR